MSSRPKRGALIAGLVFFLIGAIFFWLRSGGSARVAIQDASSTVILLTLDGVRLHELTKGTDPELTDVDAGQSVMPYLMNDLVPRGSFLGDVAQGNHFGLGNPMGLSMPGYQSILTGRLGFCVSNECAPPWPDTLLDSIQETFRDPGPPVYFLSAYEPLCRGVQASGGEMKTVCGRSEALEHLKNDPAEKTREGPASKDEAVFQSALKHLRERPPRFLYIGLDESDSAAHSGSYAAYLDVLKRYDHYIRDLHREILRLEEAGRKVSLFITTDHGRGHDSEWTGHRWNISGTSDLWFVGVGHAVKAQGIVENGPNRSQFNIRPTIEYFLGINDRDAWFQSEAMTELMELP